MSKKLHEALTREPQPLLDTSRQLWLAHHNSYKTDLTDLLAVVHYNASRETNPENLADFPKPLVDYRRFASTVISAMLYYSEAGELHPSLYKFSHTLGLIKDVYYTGRLAEYPDWDAYKQTVTSSDIVLEPQHTTAAKRPVVKERFASLLNRIETIASLNSPIAVSEMHDIRKQLRGLSFMLSMRLEFNPDKKLRSIDDDIRKLVKQLGDLHDGFITMVTLNTDNTAEFNAEYARQTVQLPPKLREKIVDVLNK